MPSRDLHDKPFDEGTKKKLAIYRSYVRAWLQVFLHASAFIGKPLQFFDFFCGPGQDPNGESGSPLILLEELAREGSLIAERRHQIRIFFNDNDAKKIKTLRLLCAERGFLWQPRFESLDFQEAFGEARSEFNAGPALVFIDQNGVKHITKPIFEVLTQAETTDFLFFTASSFKWRFGDLLAPEISFPADVSYLDVHRVLADRYREWAPNDVFVGHFSIKKESNIYGLIFGSHHWRGMQKFLEIAWKLDAECGEANYEIEGDTTQGQMFFEQGQTGFKKRKIEVFKEKLEQFIQFRESTSDRDVFLYCLTNGFLPRVAKDVYEKMRQEGLLKNARIEFPRYSDSAMKEPRRLVI